MKKCSRKICCYFSVNELNNCGKHGVTPETCEILLSKEQIWNMREILISDVKPLILKVKEIVDAWNEDNKDRPDSPLAKHPLTKESEQAFEAIRKYL